MAALGAYGIARHRHRNEAKPHIGVFLHHSRLSCHWQRSLACLRLDAVRRGRHFHLPQHRLGSSLSLDEKDEKGCMAGRGILTVGLCMVLHCLGTELFTTQHLSKDRHETNGGKQGKAQGFRISVC